jgi:predicted  nucleic acid-binding Zn-ribbon protein
MILKSIRNEDEAQQFVSLVYDIQEIQKRTGLSLEALDNKAHELERKATDLEPRAQKAETTLTALNKELQRIQSARIFFWQIDFDNFFVFIYIGYYTSFCTFHHNVK